MIIKDLQRGRGKDFADHLTNDRDNDHVELHELRGFAAEDLHGAFFETEALAKGTQCRKPFFHVIVNPPETRDLTYGEFERAFAALDDKFNLHDHARAVVFHEKDGRRHAHVAWSRIDTEHMRAAHLAHSHRKCQDVARALIREFGLEKLPGHENRKDRSPDNFTRDEWQAAVRRGDDPQEIKRVIREALEYADSRKAFEAALGQQGMFLARGDRRGFVVVDHRGQVHSLSRATGQNKKALQARLGDFARLPTVEQTRALVKERVSAALKRRAAELKRRQSPERARMKEAVERLKAEHRAQRDTVWGFQRDRRRREELDRANRLRKGIMGLWDRMSGHYGRLSDENRREAEACTARDRKERQELIDSQRGERRQLQKAIDHMKEKHRRERDQLRREIGFLISTDRQPERDTVREHMRERDDTRQRYRDQQREFTERKEREEQRQEKDRAAEEARREQERPRDTGRARDDGPDLDFD